MDWNGDAEGKESGDRAGSCHTSRPRLREGSFARAYGVEMTISKAHQSIRCEREGASERYL